MAAERNRAVFCRKEYEGKRSVAGAELLVPRFGYGMLRIFRAAILADAVAAANGLAAPESALGTAFWREIDDPDLEPPQSAPIEFLKINTL